MYRAYLKNATNFESELFFSIRPTKQQLNDAMKKGGWFNCNPEYSKDEFIISKLKVIENYPED
jgi:hypothetical protein